MQENVSVLIATIMAVVLVVLFPIYNIAVRQDSMSNNMVVKTTTNFVDKVRNKGYITDEDYEDYVEELGKTGNMYEVEMETYEPILIEMIEGSEEYEEKYKIKYTKEILEEIGIEGERGEVASKENSIVRENVSYLDTDYKFYVRVKNTNQTQAQVLLGKLFNGESENRIVVNYGGIVYANNWVMGENAEVTSANIFISRPMDNDGVEYRKEEIATIYNDVTEQEEKLYGIAVRLNDDVINSGIVKFKLTYKDILGFRKTDGTYISNAIGDSYAEERASHVKTYIETENFNAGPNDDNIEVRELSRVDRQGIYDYEYEITIKDIQYNYENNPYVEANIQIKEGSADTKAGEIGRLRSDEFIIFYELNKPTISIREISPDVRTTPVQSIYEGSKLEFKLGINASLVSSVAKVDRLIIEMQKDGGEIEKTEITATAAMRDGTNVEFPTRTSELDKGKYNVTIYAIDTRNHESDRITFSFEIKYIERKVETFTLSPMVNRAVNTINTKTPSGTGWKIVSYRLQVNLPNHTPYPCDYWRAVDTTNGRNTIINPSNHNLTDSVSVIRLFKVYNRYCHWVYTGFCDEDNSWSYPEASKYTVWGHVKKDTTHYYNINNYVFNDLRIDIKKGDLLGINNVVGYYWINPNRTYDGYRSNLPVDTGTIECRNQNITSLQFNYRISPSHDYTSAKYHSYLFSDLHDIYNLDEYICREKYCTNDSRMTAIVTYERSY